LHNYLTIIHKSKIFVQTLLGCENLQFYLRCLSSLQKFNNQKVNLLVHSDGSLEEENLSVIQNSLGCNVSFINPKDAKERTLDNLKNFPNCQKFRKNSLWGIEFFDPLFSQTDDRYSYYIDADILFSRPFTDLFKESMIEGGAVFLEDTQWDAYSFRPWQMIGRRMRPVVVKGITTALVFWDKRVIEWDYLEWFLSQSTYHSISNWILPTAQAGLATRCDSKVVSANQITNLYPNATISSENFGLHLLGSYRKSWLQKIDHSAHESRVTDAPIETKFKKCSNRGIFAYSYKQLTRWVNTRFNKW